MKEFVAIGGGGTHQIGDVNPRVLHGLTVPVDEQFILRVARQRPVGLAFPGPQAFSIFFQFGGVLDETLVLVEIVILAAGRTFGGTADMTFLLELVLAQSSETGGTPTHGGAYVGKLGIGFFPVDGAVSEVIGKTVGSQEDAMAGGARVSGGGIAFVGAVGLETSVTFLTLARMTSVIVLLIGLFTA